MPQSPALLQRLLLIVTATWSFVCLAEDGTLKDQLSETLAQEGLTGIAWAAIGDDATVSADVFGMQDTEMGSAFTRDTRFHVGSLTKTVLATGVLRLAAEGQIDLDAPILRHLPERFKKSPPIGLSEITTRHLLDHTAGLNDAYLWQMFSERADPDAPLSAAFPDPTEQLQVRVLPGSRFGYSNMGYTLLGIVIESVTGRRYETYLDEQVLAPLGMHNSTFRLVTQIGVNADDQIAWGHVDDASRIAASPMFLRPAGQFTTTAGDLALLLEFLLDDGDIDGETFVDASLMKSRGSARDTEAANAGLIAGYSLGLGRRDRHGVVGLCHGGNTVGITAMLCIFPIEKKAFAYSVNTDSETADYGRLDALFIRSLDLPAAKTPRTSEPEDDMGEWHGRYVLSPNRFETLEYLDDMFGSIKIASHEDGLIMTSLQRDDRILRPVGGRLYSANDRTTTSHVFYKSENSQYFMSDGFSTYRKVENLRYTAQWTSAMLGLFGLIACLLIGVTSVVRYRLELFRRPEAAAFVSSLLLFAPIPLFMFQSFLALGDLTIASGLLSFVTLLLPLGMMITLVSSVRAKRSSRTGLLVGVAAAMVLQWCAVLLANGLLPLRLWVL